MDKSLLLKLIKVMFGLLFATFAYVLIVGIGGSNESRSKNSNQRFASVDQGQSRLLRLEGKKAWLTRLTISQRNQLSLLTKELSNHRSGCKITAELCGVFSETSQRGIDLSFSASAPPHLPSSFSWFGGFVDPTTGAIFDLLGRAYRLGLETDAQQPSVIEF